MGYFALNVSLMVALASVAACGEDVSEDVSPEGIIRSGLDQDDGVLIGSWEGQAVVSDATQRTIVFNVERGEDGGLTGTMESPDEGPRSRPLSSVTLEDGTITIRGGRIIRITFRGTLSDDGATLVGTMSQLGSRLPLELTKRE